MSAPAAAYEAATRDAVVIDRTDRVPIRAHGRDPLRMMQGLLTNDLAGAPDGRAVYAALLTPKGRMVAEVRALKQPPDVRMDVDGAALEGLLATLKKFVPPLFARFDVQSETHGVLGVYGPRARDVVVTIAGDAPPDDAPEDAFVALDDVLVLRTYVNGGAGGYDLIATRDRIDALRAAAREAGAVHADLALLDVLRIEAGRPMWGAELGEDVIPLEAGLKDRAISQTKGCYTGQEVIIRILHRGHVNRHLRGLLLDGQSPPAKDTPLFRADDGKQVGVVTSACASPAHGGAAIGLGYVRREVQPPGEVRLGAPDGPAVTVVELPFGAD